jgi:hypothetical protein
MRFVTYFAIPFERVNSVFDNLDLITRHFQITACDSDHYNCWPVCLLSYSLCHKLKLHVFDLLWICRTIGCTVNPQQIHNFSTNPQQIHNISTRQDKSTANPQEIKQMESEL